MKHYRSNLGKIFFCIAFSALSFFMILPTQAASHRFAGTLEHRVLDGSKNGIYYSITPNVGLSISGTVSCNACASHIEHVNPTYVVCMEGASSGRGKIICKATVNVGIYQSEDFTASGVPTTDQCYMYTHKTEDDGYDLAISGEITQ